MTVTGWRAPAGPRRVGSVTSTRSSTSTRASRSALSSASAPRRPCGRRRWPRCGGDGVGARLRGQRAELAAGERQRSRAALDVGGADGGERARSTAPATAANASSRMRSNSAAETHSPWTGSKVLFGADNSVILSCRRAADTGRRARDGTHRGRSDEDRRDLGASIVYGGARRAPRAWHLCERGLPGSRNRTRPRDGARPRSCVGLDQVGDGRGPAGAAAAGRAPQNLEEERRELAPRRCPRPRRPPPPSAPVPVAHHLDW